jgi:hypothetical protein
MSHFPEADFWPGIINGMVRRFRLARNTDEVILLVSENGSSISQGAMVSSVFNFDSCCSLRLWLVFLRR